MLIMRLLYALVEGVLFAGAGPGLLGDKLKGKTLFTTGLLLGLIAMGVRLVYDYFQITVISHTYVLMVVIAVVFWQVSKLKFFKAVVATVLSTTLLLVSEVLFLFPVMQYWGLTLELVLFEPLLFILAAILSLLCLLIALMGVYLFDFALIRDQASKSHLEENEKI